MSTIQIFHLLLEVIIVLIGLYLIFFKSYLQEKGKNAATKDDIGEITKKVEAVKNSFLHETEKLKLDLQFSNDMKLSIKTEEKNSVLHCYESFYMWYTALEDFSFVKYDDVVKLNEQMDKINDFYFTYVLAKAKLDLYVKYERINIDIIDLSGVTRSFMHEVTMLSYDYEKVLFRAEKGGYKSSQEELEAKREVLNKLMQVRAQNTDEIIPKLRGFRENCYEFLSEMIK